MWRTVLTVILFLMFGQFTAAPADFQQTLPPTLAQDTILYLPLVNSPQPILEAVATASGPTEYDPMHAYVYGYVNNLINEPIYAAVVDLEVTIIPFGGPPYTTIVHITPAFAATLPGQINPFKWTELNWKTSYDPGPIVDVRGSTWKTGDYHPLTIVSWSLNGTNLTGIARNDSGYTLDNLRVVAAELKKCEWQLATPDVATLLPGQETGFQLMYYSDCSGDDLVVLGQGAAQR